MLKWMNARRHEWMSECRVWILSRLPDGQVSNKEYRMLKFIHILNFYQRKRHSKKSGVISNYMLSKIGKFRSVCEEITQTHLAYKKEALMIILQPWIFGSFTHPFKIVLRNREFAALHLFQDKRTSNLHLPIDLLVEGDKGFCSCNPFNVLDLVIQNLH